MHLQVATQDQEDRGKRPVDRLRRVQAVSEGGGGGEGGWDGCRSGLSELGGGARGHAIPQILTDQLNLNQGVDYVHHITTYPPGFSDLPTALDLVAA